MSSDVEEAYGSSTSSPASSTSRSQPTAQPTSSIIDTVHLSLIETHRDPCSTFSATRPIFFPSGREVDRPCLDVSSRVLLLFRVRVGEFDTKVALFGVLAADVRLVLGSLGRANVTRVRLRLRLLLFIRGLRGPLLPQFEGSFHIPRTIFI